jgi:hypothetical protein
VVIVQKALSCGLVPGFAVVVEILGVRNRDVIP